MSRDECMEKLEQYVLDEDRIMTYKILSQELKIHVNIAKQYLSDFLKIQESKNTSMLASYFLAGFVKIDGIKTMKVLVVSQKNLEKEKGDFSEITSCHIYSLSKCDVDECALLIAERCVNDTFVESNKYSAIKHINVETKPVVLKKVCVPKTEPKSSLPKKQEPAPLKNGGSSFFQSKQTEKKNKTASENVKIENVPETKSETTKDTSEKPKPKEDPKSMKSNTLASMWQKKEEKAKNDKTETSKPESKGKTKSPSKSTKNIPKNNIMSMFSKQAERNSENLFKKAPVESSSSNKKPETDPPKKVHEDPLKTSPSENGTKSRKPSKTNSTKRKSSSRQTKKPSKKSDEESDDEIQPKNKKRRRICAFEDSDSESENEEAQDRAQCTVFSPEDPLESPEVVKSSPAVASDDSEEPIPPTPPVLPGVKGRKKYLKTVQNTYQDEDGFFVTKQEKKLVSESESDEEVKPNNKNSPKKDVGKPSIFAYRKQASLTSFFKQS